MKFFGRLKKIRYIKLNADAFLYINLPHNRWMTSAQQLMDIRTAADMQAHNSCCAVHDSNFSNDIYYLFQQLILYLPTTYPISSNNLFRFFQHPFPYLSTPQSTFENRRRHINIEQQRLENGEHVYRIDETTGHLLR